MIDLLPGERELARASGRTYEVVLTDQRVVSKGRALGEEAEQVILLRSIDSLEVGGTRNPFFLAAAAVCGISSLSGQVWLALAGAVVFVGLWWFRPRRGARITSHSGQTTITLHASRGHMGAVTQFATAVQRALHAPDAPGAD